MEQNGIVFIDEIDKIAKRGECSAAPDVSREGRAARPAAADRGLHGQHQATAWSRPTTSCSSPPAPSSLAKPADLIPELQGRLPIRVELKALTTEDFERILTEPHASLTDQYKALLDTEGLQHRVHPGRHPRMAEIAWQVNEKTENIGARRLHTLLERLLEEVSFSAADLAGQQNGAPIRIDAAYVNSHLGELAQDEDLSRYIL